jgi:hypothetical protein
MLGDTISIFQGGSGGTEHVLKKVNQDNFSAEYLKRDLVNELRLKIRHSVEKVASGDPEPLERHNVELTVVSFADAENNLPEFRRVYSTTIRVDKTRSAYASSTYWQEGMSFFLDDTITPLLLGWES